MPMEFFAFSDQLSEVVSRVYVHDTGRLASGPWLIPPDGDIKLIFPARGPIRCSIGDGSRVHPPSRLIVSGMRTEPGHLEFAEGVDAIGVIVRPEAAHRLLAMPQDELSNRTFDGEELFGPIARAWSERLMDAPDTAARVAIVQAIVLEMLAAQPRYDADVARAVRRLRSTRGTIQIERLARDLQWSRRRLERRFLNRVGVTPKNLASVLRFHDAYKRLRSLPDGRYGVVALDRYYDQSHFIRDFKRFTGVTPRVYARSADYGRLYIPR